jgi:hypothetical protein
MARKINRLTARAVATITGNGRHADPQPSSEAGASPDRSQTHRRAPLARGGRIGRSAPSAGEIRAAALPSNSTCT